MTLLNIFCNKNILFKNTPIKMNLQEKIRLGEESLLDFSHITKFDLSNEGARIALVQHILHSMTKTKHFTGLAYTVVTVLLKD